MIIDASTPTSVMAGRSIAGVAVGMTTALAIWQIMMHFRNYSAPQQQRCIVRILFITPIYAWTSFLSIIDIEHFAWYDAVASCYEGFVIYSFFSLLLNYLGDNHLAQKAKVVNKPPGKCFWPWGYFLSYNPKSGSFLITCKRGVLQYIAIGPMISIVELALYATGHLELEGYSPKKPYVWFIIIEFLSISLAMNCLIQFYFVIKDDIAKYKPIPKFLSVKLVVFFCWAQTVVLTGFVTFGFIKDTWLGSANYTGEAIGYFIICIEMLIVSACHKWIFAVEPYHVEIKPRVMPAMWDAIAGVDVIKDVVTVLRSNKKGKHVVHSDADEAEMKVLEEPIKPQSAKKKGASNAFMHNT